MKTANRMRRRITAHIRVIIALALLCLSVYAYLSTALAANNPLAVIVKGQFSAALIRAGTAISAPAAATVIAILGVTLLFGRVFCSVCCPLGTAQELIWRFGRIFRRGKSPPRPANCRTTPSPRGAAPKTPALAARRSLFRAGYRASSGLRYLVPLAVAAGLLFSFSPLIMMFDPLSNFGRAMMALRSITLGSAAGFGFVLATLFVLILVTAFFRGRAFCSWCPVGVALGAVSRFSVFAPRIKPDCVSCGICEKKCPAGCIDAGQKYIETERCVLCFSCTAGCPQTQVEYGLRFSGKLKKAADGGGDGGGNPRRREFLKQSATFACGVAYIMMPSLKMLFRRAGVGARAHAGGSAASAVTAVNTVTDATLPVLPPGASHFGHYKARCIGCQACAASCPVGIISPGNSPHPVLHYISSGCQFTCTECGKVCPTGAINRLSPEEKQRTRIALSSLQFETCIVKTKHEACGACAEVCPTGAITMTPYNEPEIPYLTRPALDEQYCIGCGACLVACPASLRDMPNPALTITAVTRQTLTAGVRPASEAGNELNVFTAEEFPF